MTTRDLSTTKARRQPSDPVCLVRWVFQRGRHALTCAVDLEANGSAFEVWIMPHWDLSVAAIERFDAPGGALWRHAEIAWHLRQSGWVVSEYGVT